MKPEINFNEFLHLQQIYWIGHYSDAEILFKLSCHGNAMNEIEQILRLREFGTEYTNQHFDVLVRALKLLELY